LVIAHINPTHFDDLGIGRKEQEFIDVIPDVTTWGNVEVSGGSFVLSDQERSDKLKSRPRIMPTFIDESGDTGPNPDQTSRHFRLAAVWVPSQAIAAALRASIQQVRQNLNLRANYEFKFSKTWSHQHHRQAFFQAVMMHEFRFAVSSIDKRDGDWATATKQAFHWASTVSLAGSLRQTYLAAHRAMVAGGRNRPLDELVVVDDNQDKGFLQMVRERHSEGSVRHTSLGCILLEKSSFAILKQTT
jgi:hypothetical protein